MIEIPGYTILRPLGKGGMAEVYLAIQKSFDREVALKVMHQAQAADEEFSQRFLREAKIVSRLVHPNIVTVYDVGIVDGHHFLSMEYISGEDLKQARGKLPLSRTIEVIKDIARALAFAGKKGYVHRDVKPENIMLQEDSGRAVLMDFGIARPSDFQKGMTQTGTAIGTPHYMSPEQARGKEVDQRSDLYGLGVVLFLMLTGRVPFDADSAVAVGVKHVSEPVPRLPQQLQLFQPIIDCALAKLPAERFQTGDEFLQALDAIPLQALLNLERLQAAQQGRYEHALDDHMTAINPLLTHSNEDIKQSAVASRPPVTHSQEYYREPPVVVHRSSSGAWAWWLGLLIAGVIGCGVYFQQQLPVEQRTAIVSSVMGGIDNLFGDQFPVQQVDNLPVQNEPDSEAVLGEYKAVASTLATGRIERTEAEGELMDDVAAVAVEEPPEVQLESEVKQVAVNTPAIDSMNSLSPMQAAVDERQRQLALAQELEEQLDERPELAIEAAQIYRQMMERNPTDIEAGQGLQNLRVFITDRVQARLDDRDFTAASEALVLARAVLPESIHESRLRRLQESIEAGENIAPLLLQAKQYLDKNYLTSPKETNALAVYQQVLAMDASNQDAIAGLDAIAARYLAMGKKHLSVGSLVKAQNSANKGLAIRPSHGGLEVLLQQTQQALQLQQLWQQYERQMQQRQLLAPSGDSALETLREIVSLNADQDKAVSQIRIIEDGLIDGVEDKIQLGLWQEARAEIARALAYFPQSTHLQELKSINEQAMLEASQPRVTQLILSQSALNGVAGSQQPLLLVDTIIYAGFEFENFDPLGTTLEARLYEGLDLIEIDRQVLTIVSEKGVHFFILESPLSGFASGPYQLELVLRDKILTTTAFEVQRPAEPVAEPTIDPRQQVPGTSGILPP